MTEPIYTIRLTRKQLGEVRRALEACFRMGIGQPGDALEYCLDESGKPCCYGWETQKAVEQILKPIMGLHPQGSWGVGRFDSLDALCEMYHVIQHFMSWEYAVKEGLVPSMSSPRDWKTMMGCNYDEPMRYTQEPMIVVAREGDR
jgi:hypothetical protein